jgi:gas vesicle protein
MKFLLGFAIGFGLAVVFAPAPGSETREQLKNKARELIRYPEQRIEEKVAEAAEQAEQKAGDIGSRIGRDVAQATVKAVRSEMLNKDDQQSA